MNLILKSLLIILFTGLLASCASNAGNSSEVDKMPKANRFAKDVLDFNLNEPMELDELPGRGIVFVERRGAIKLYDFKTEATLKIAQLDLFYGNEDGLLGIAVDPDYENNNWIYLFYSAPGDEPKQHVSRFDLVGDELVMASEKILLTIPTIRKCCHSGGSLEFGPNGNLFIGIGDNTNPFESNGYAPIDEREGRALWDAQKSAGNTNDLRGKILRIKPEADGTYSIPKGNLFPEGTENTRPEIYVMGCRNPFRPSIDSKTGFVYWGDVGPDAGESDPNRGPEGFGEFDQAREAGFYGWPYTRGNNQSYNDYDFAAQKSGDKFVPEKIINNSPNNTGIQELPPVQESMIWFGYDKSEEFPWLGKGGVNPMSGPVFHASDVPNAKSTFPAYFENKLFVYEWMRDWVYVVTLDDNYNYVKAEPFMPKTEFSHPMDMIFGSDGNLYVLEYGQKWNSQNMDARLDRVRYIPGNRTPIARINSDIEVGAAPLTVQFSGEESEDYDNDKLSYEWTFNGEAAQTSEMNSSFTFETPGIYNVKLQVSDKKGETSTANKKIMVGNAPPKLAIETDATDDVFRTGKIVNYKVVVSDKEDGSTEDQTIDPEKVRVTYNYLPEGEDMVIATIGHQQNTVPEGLKLIDASDCKACHAINEKVNGPSYTDIAKKYTKEDKNYLISRIKKGGSGVWGETMMAAHPQLKMEEVGTIVSYILSLDPDAKMEGKVMPISGTLSFKDHLKNKGEGKYILMASYLDNGNPEVEESSLSARESLVFRSPKIELEKADELSEGLETWKMPMGTVVGSLKHNCYLKFTGVGLADLSSIKLAAGFSKDYAYKGKVEVRESSPTGNVIGEVEVSFFDAGNIGEETFDISVKPTVDKADLFLVFKNAENEKQFVMNGDWIYLNYAE